MHRGHSKRGVLLALYFSSKITIFPVSFTLLSEKKDILLASMHH